MACQQGSSSPTRLHSLGKARLSFFHACPGLGHSCVIQCSRGRPGIKLNRRSSRSPRRQRCDVSHVVARLTGANDRARSPKWSRQEKITPQRPATSVPIALARSVQRRCSLGPCRCPGCANCADALFARPCHRETCGRKQGEPGVLRQHGVRCVVLRAHASAVVGGPPMLWATMFTSSGATCQGKPSLCRLSWPSHTGSCSVTRRVCFGDPRSGSKGRKTQKKKKTNKRGVVCMWAGELSTHRVGCER